ncbi:hypothetical protein ACJRPG_0021530 [Massilia sp. SM-13]
MRQDRKAALSVNISLEREAMSAPPRFEWWSWIAGSVAILTLLGLLCAMAGYGVAVSIEDVFGVPFQSIATTHFDHLQLSYIAIFHLVDVITPPKDQWAHFFQILKTFAAIYAGAVLLNALILSFFVLSKRYPKAGGAFEKAKRFIQPSIREDAFWVSIVKFLLYGGIATVVTAAGVWGLTVLGVAVLVLLIGAPLLGLEAGKAYLRTYVEKPERCRPLQDRTARLRGDRRDAKEVFVTCVRYESKEKLMMEGRVVFMTAASVVLFDPENGRVTRLPMQEASITLIDALKCCDAPNSPK